MKNNKEPHDNHIVSEFFKSGRKTITQKLHKLILKSGRKNTYQKAGDWELLV